MSIIRDALKKARKNGDMEMGRSAGGGVGKPRTSGLLVVLALTAGVTALGVIGWRTTGVIKARKFQTPQTVSSTPAPTAPVPSYSVMPVPVSLPEADRGNELTRQAERLFWLGDLAGSERGFREAMATGAGDSAELANNLGLVLRKQGKLKEAVKLFDEALDRNPGMVEALNNRAVAYRKMKRYTEAIADLEKVLESDPGSGHAQFNLGTVYEALGQVKEAIRYYRQYLGNPSRTPGLDEALIKQRIIALEAEESSISWRPQSAGKEGR